MTTYNNKKVIYFADPMGDLESDKETLEMELRQSGLIFRKINVTDAPPFDEKYDVLFFDWGGMSLGNSMMEFFCRHILEEALKYPSRYYCMVSMFTREAMKEAQYDMKGTCYPNVFLTVEAFSKSFLEQEK